MQDLSDLSMQYNGLKSLLYSNVGIVFGNTVINIAQRSLLNVVIYLLKQKIKI